MSETPKSDSPELDAVEAAIQKARNAQKICARCGPRVEADAIYCSNCGAKIPTADRPAST